MTPTALAHIEDLVELGNLYGAFTGLRAVIIYFKKAYFSDICCHEHLL